MPCYAGQNGYKCAIKGRIWNVLNSFMITKMVIHDMPRVPNDMSKGKQNVIEK